MKRVILWISLIGVLAIVGVLIVKKSALAEVVLSPIFKDSYAVQITKKLDEVKIDLDIAIKTTNPETVEASISGIRVLFSPKKDLSASVRALQIILSSLTMEQNRPREIDLRFDKPILRH